MNKYIILHAVFFSLSLIILTLYFNAQAFGAAVSFPWLQIEEKLPVTGKVSGSVTVQTITGASGGGGSCEQCQFVVYHAKTSAPSSAVITHASTTPLDLSGAKRIVFFAKGELGGETIKALAIGKSNPRTLVPGEKPPFKLMSHNIVLTNDWKRYELSLKGLDLKNTISPFGLEISNQRSGIPILNPPIEKTPLNNRNAKDISIYLKGVSLDDNPAANPLNANTSNSSRQTLTAKIVANSTKGPAPYTIQFEGNVTGGLAPYSYGWNFDLDNNNSTAVGPKVLRTFDEPGNYTITLGVKDSGSPPNNASAIMAITITPSAYSSVNSTVRVEANSTSNNDVNSTVRVEANSTDNNDLNSTNSGLQSISEGNNMLNNSARVAMAGVSASNSSAIGQDTIQDADSRNDSTQTRTIFSGFSNASHGARDKNTAADEFATPFGSNVTDSNNADGIASDNHSPIATDQSVIIYTNRATGIVLKGADPDKDPITYEIVLGPLKGTLAGFNKQTGTVTYIPNQISPGSDSFSFKVVDRYNKESNVAQVSEMIKVKPDDENTRTDISPSDQSPNSTPVVRDQTTRTDISPSDQSPNSTPVVRDQKINVNQNSKVRIILQGIDADHDKLIYSVVDYPSHGEMISFDSSTGKLTYRPEDNFAGQDMFKFKVTDQKGVDSRVGSIKVNVGVREHSDDGADLLSVEKVPADQMSTSASPVINSNPTVNAGPDRVIYTGTNNVVLKGYAYDPDADPLSYLWKQTAGWTVELRNPNSAEPTFSIPAIVENKVLRFVLTVSDGRGGQDTDDVKIIIKDRLPNRTFQDRTEPLQTFNHTLQFNR
jgi:hypothetical protein